MFAIGKKIADATTAQIWVLSMATDVCGVMPAAPTFFVLAAPN